MERYDSYKDSGVEWIGEIPGHWDRCQLKYLGDENQLSLSSKTRPDYELKYLEISDVDSFGRLGEPTDYVFADSPSRCRRVVRKNDVLISTVRTYLRSIGIVEHEVEDLICSTGFSVVSPNDRVVPKFLFHMCRTEWFISEVISLSEGVSYPSIQSDKLMGCSVIKPPLHEQEQIVEYLDRKTTLIDSLIEKTVRKIELLKEKRTSLINEVVTKGLNPDVEMKDSGVEWIGEIPSHWEVSKLKYSSQVLPSNVDKHIFPDEIQVRLCNYTDVYYNEKVDDSLQLKEGSCTESEFKKFLLTKGDVIVTKDSESPDDIGIPTLVNSDFEDVVCGYHLTLFRSYRVHGGYLFRFIQSTGTRRYFEVNSNGITRFSLGKSTLEDLTHPTPPLHEQEQIVEYLDEQTSIIDSTITAEEKRIELLKEYRQSLISEVVTGKVKV